MRVDENKTTSASYYLGFLQVVRAWALLHAARYGFVAIEIVVIRYATRYHVDICV